ncbi:holo-[acyl-carrier-protein] synthase [Candidatus Poribacteria bacterium]|nr:holo-[acyl-carrier-protein] synthase [Candidatus Poribacteria bacterium]
MLDGRNIVGIGLDIIEVSRIESVLNRWGSKFEQRVFTPKELDYCRSKGNYYQKLASRFAVKEAVFKALGTGWQAGVGWREIEVTNNHMGKPKVTLNGETERISKSLGVKLILVSMTHTKEYGAAQVILTS